MLKICSLVENIPIADAGDACSEELFPSSQMLFCLLNLPEFDWGLLLHTFTSRAHIFALISRKFFIWFPKALFEVEPNLFDSKRLIT